MTNQDEVSKTAAIAAEMIAQLSPVARIDASLVIDLRERLMSKTGCSWETARQAILTELQKRPCVSTIAVGAEKTSPDPGRPKSNHNPVHPPSTIAVRGTPEEVRIVRRIIPDNRQRLMILLDWIAGR